MKEAIYSWIKCLAIFYILLTMLIHLVPTGTYQRYVRFFMGLLLMVMLITPMLSILEKAKTLPESFSSLYQQEEKKAIFTGESCPAVYSAARPSGIPTLVLQQVLYIHV